MDAGFGGGGVERLAIEDVLWPNEKEISHGRVSW
jgi:hypothetical protein